MIRGKTRREQEEMVAGIDIPRQAKKEENGLGAGREAKGKEPHELVKPWAKHFQPGKCPIGRPCP